MAITISISSTANGSCKTTISCLFAYFLSASYKVLVIDLCSQCHATELFSGHVDFTKDRTICDAFETGDFASNIACVTNNLHILPGDLWISSVPASLYSQGYSAIEVIIALKDLLNQAKTRYDFVVIDTPSLSANELFSLALSASDFAIMTYSPNKIELIDEWLDKIRHVQDVFNPELKVGGILRTRFNKIEASHKFHCQEVVRRYPEYCWNSNLSLSPLFANLDLQSTRKSGIISAFKPVYDEFIFRLLMMGNGGIEVRESTP